MNHRIVAFKYVYINASPISCEKLQHIMQLGHETKACTLSVAMFVCTDNKRAPKVT